MSKSINFNAMKKGLGKQVFGECAVSMNRSVCRLVFECGPVFVCIKNPCQKNLDINPF